MAIYCTIPIRRGGRAGKTYVVALRVQCYFKRYKLQVFTFSQTLRRISVFLTAPLHAIIYEMMDEIFELQMMMLSKGKRSSLVDSDIMIQEEGMSSDQSVTNVCSCNSGPPPEDDSSDTSLRLG